MGKEMTPTFEAARNSAAILACAETDIDDGGEQLSFKVGYRRGANWSRKWHLESAEVRGLVEASSGMLKRFAEQKAYAEQNHLRTITFELTDLVAIADALAAFERLRRE